MNLTESIRLALDGLRANKMRSLLTMLGIIIGIAAVISILTVGKSLTSTVSNSFNELGSSNIYYYVASKNSSDQMVQTSYYTPPEKDLITDDMIEVIQNRFQGKVSSIGVMASGPSGQAKDGRLYANINFQGATPDVKSLNNVDMKSGRFLTKRDIEGSRNVAVVSDKFVNNMYGGRSEKALGQSVNITFSGRIESFTIIGIYKHTENPMMGMVQKSDEKDISTSVYIPISRLNQIMGKSATYESIIVSVAPSENIEKIDKSILDFLNNTYYANNTSFMMRSQSMESITKQVETTMSTLSVGLSVIAAISLLVGGIGVMNIMLVSVTERTREIGVRKALGATNRAIQIQFITESIIVCLIGGFIGIILGAIFGYVGSDLLGEGVLPGLSPILISFTFSISIGMFFGYYPASRAAKLDPIEALRYE